MAKHTNKKHKEADATTKLLWRFLLDKGHRILSESYYGDEIDLNYHNIDRDSLYEQINWMKTEEPRVVSDCRFCGTFVDSDNIESYRGELIKKDGKTEVWKFEMNDEMSFRDIVEMVVKYMGEEK